MDAETWSRARALFDQLLGEDAPTRARQLSALSQDDEGLRRAVESLFESHDVLSRTDSDPFAQAIGRVVTTMLSGGEIGDRYGPFKTTAELGRGGMGVVYLAERCDGSVEQVVALKVLSARYHDADSVRRLNQERQLLARLEHPHIARFIDAGENAQGAPYFAMEYVCGRPITRYCDDHELSIAQRLALFRAVCSGVRYAHTNLVVHGDLKPGNILVTEDGIPKLLDFGIAVSLRRDPAMEADAGSASDMRFFSANCAAPEQLRGQPGSIATDVYSLGVLLCELLGGRRPYDLNDLTLSEVMAVVCEHPPLLPSAAISADSARMRGGLSQRALQRSLRGDLDQIVAKALSKKPEDRYLSVEQLIQDIDRHAVHRPVAARRHERGYSSRKFIRRHILALGFSAATAVLLVGFLFYALFQNQQLSEERDAAHRQELQAQFERDRVQQVTDFLVNLFQSADPAKSDGQNITARQLLERGAHRLESDLGQQPLIRAAMLAAIADIYIELDQFDLAEAAANQAWKLRKDARPADSGALAASFRQMARLANLRGEPAEALSRIDQAIALDMSGNRQTRIDALSIQAKAMEGAGQAKQAVTVWRQALALAGEEQDQSGAAMSIAFNLARLLRATGSLPEAEHVIRQHLTTNDSKFSGEARAMRANLLFELAVIARNRGDLDEARLLAQRSYESFIAIYGDRSSQAATAANTLATIAQAKGDVVEARRLFETSLDVRREVYGDENPRVASAEYNLGLLLLLRQHDPANAAAHLRRAVDTGGRILPPNHANLANYRLGYGSALRDLGRYAEARAELIPALRAFREIAAPRGIDIALSEGELACSSAASEKGDADALRSLEAAVVRLREYAPDDPQAKRVFDCLQRWNQAALVQDHR